MSNAYSGVSWAEFLIDAIFENEPTVVFKIVLPIMLFACKKFSKRPIFPKAPLSILKLKLPVIERIKSLKSG